MTSAKLGLVLLGVVFFTFALRTNAGWARWAGIACVALALVLRVVERLRSKL